MKKIVSIVFAFSGLVAISQNISYKIGTEYESTEKHKDLGYFLAADNLPVNVSFSRENDFSIQPIDPNTSNVSSGYLHDIKELDEEAIFERVFNLKDNLFYIYSTINKKNKTRVLNARLIDNNNKSVSNKNVVLFESPEPKTLYLEPFKPTRYYFKTSTNNEYCLVTCIYEDREKKAKLNKKEIGFCVFDKNLNVKISKVIEMPYFENLMHVIEYTVDSKGDLFMLIGHNKEDANGDPKFAGYQLIKINKDGTFQAKDLNTEGKYIKTYAMTDDINGNITITGYYGVEKKTGGIFIYRFGVDGDPKAPGAGIRFYDFTLDLFKAYESTANQEDLENEGKLDAGLNFDDIFFHPNGDIVIVNEMYKATTNEKGAVIRNYFFDIISIKVNKDGKLVWMKKIPKNQRGMGKADLSYKYYHHNGNDYFIFVDNENNLNISPDQTPKAHISRQGGFLVAVKVDQQGFIQKLPVFDLKTENISIFPTELLKVKDNMLIGRGSKERKKLPITLTFK